MSTITGTLSNQKNREASSRVHSFVRAAIWALPLWAAMLFLSTLTHQPDPQTDFANFAAYVTTSQFLFSHLVNSIAGAAIGSIGVIALTLHLQDSRAAGKAITGMVAAVTGNTLTASVFGAAAFAQSGIGHAYLSGKQDALDYYNLVYAAPLFGTVLVGILLFIIGGIFTGIAVTKSGLFARWTGWVYGIASVAFVLFNIFFAAAQSFTLVFLFAATLVVAWTVSRKDAWHDETQHK